MKQALICFDPIVNVIAEQAIDWQGVQSMTEWVRDRYPACLPDDYAEPEGLFPHALHREHGDREALSDNELLVELAGRKCYNSFGLKAGRKSNAEYIAHTQIGEVPHRSILYHAKMTFFIAGVSRRVSHELIRNYVGADRDEEGSPSQESTRYAEHAGVYVIHPSYIATPMAAAFEEAANANYKTYQEALLAGRETFKAVNGGAEPKGMDHKRILEAASSLLFHSVETSFIWTTNPSALAKFFKERCHEAADLEMQRFAGKWRALCYDRWPNLFPQVP